MGISGVLVQYEMEDIDCVMTLGNVGSHSTVVCLCPNVKMSDFEVLIGSSTDDLERICVL